jgi:WD40 repeat protein
MYSNLKNGLDLYTLKPENGLYLGLYKYEIDASTNYQVQCTFTNGGKWLATGGTDGLVRIYDKLGKKLLASLQVADGGLVQTIAVCFSPLGPWDTNQSIQTYDGPSCGLLAAAGTNPGGGARTIQVWSFLPHAEQLVSDVLRRPPPILTS